MSEGDGVNHLDWFDMPYTRNSTLHVSKINQVSIRIKSNLLCNSVRAMETSSGESLVESISTTPCGLPLKEPKRGILQHFKADFWFF